MTAEEYLSKSMETNEIIASIVRQIKDTKVPEFSSDPLTVEDAAALTGIPETSIRAGITYGWLPIGIATRNGKEVTEHTADKGRQSFTIFPRRVWEVTGHIWRGKAALKGNVKE